MSSVDGQAYPKPDRRALRPHGGSQVNRFRDLGNLADEPLDFSP